MNGEIEVPETPNWLQELEAKREKRVKARLGHEAGAGAPCLKCGEKCPGLDLHFWRKCCKICKCSKEEHEVQDDDIYGWAQFQLLGSKPNKIKRKIVLPGKKDELELEWTPKGHNDTVDKYLKTLPPEQLPVKGSQAAQDRKQLLQKQIPVHDIDPLLCHELSNDELKQMNDYIAHVKQTSVGIGQIVSLSNIIKAHLHMLNPSEAALIASRYPKGIPLSEIVKLQSQSRANALKPHDLNEKLENLNLHDAPNKSLPNLAPNSIITTEESLNPKIASNVRDISYPGYTKDVNQSLPKSQISSGLKPSLNIPRLPDNCDNQITITPVDEKFPQNPNFDPKNTPSQFIHQSAQYGQPYSYKIGQQTIAGNESICGKGYDPTNSAFAPYNKNTLAYKPNERHIEGSPAKGSSYSSNLPIRGARSPRPGEMPSRTTSRGAENNYVEDLDPLDPNFAKNLAKYPGGYKNSMADQIQNFGTPGSASGSNVNYENVEDIKRSNRPGLPNYVPGKYNVLSETHSPTKIPKNVRELAFSTYDSDDRNCVAADQDNNLIPPNLSYENYPPGYFDNQTSPYKENLNISGHKQYGIPTGRYPDHNPLLEKNTPFNQDSIGRKPGQYPNYNPLHEENILYGQNSIGLKPSQHTGPNATPSNMPSLSGIEKIKNDDSRFQNVPFNKYAPHYGDNLSGQNPNPYVGNNSCNNVPFREHIPTTVPYAIANDPRINKHSKKLSELHPDKINIDEDYLQPSQVTIGAIQDINYPEIKAATQGTNDFYEDYSPDSLREILNNVKLPDCHYCKKPFEENEFAITIDRANVLFHAQCFKCAGCNQILADNVYFYNKETDNIYCGRDYAKVRGFPRCKACDELIFTKEYCLAENSTFHLKHFCCIECDKPLAGQDYTLEDEMPYCLPCFEHSKASKCSSCGNVIKPDEVGCNLNGVHFHAVDDCFACKVCKKPLMGKKLLLRNEKLYCSHDCFGSDKK